MEETARADKTDKVSNNSDISDDSGVLDCANTRKMMDLNIPTLENQAFNDVTFIVGDKKDKIGANRKLLMDNNDVFRSMFTGSDWKKNEFDIPDVCGDVFREVLRHVYGEEVQLKGFNVMGVLHASDHYHLPDLRQTCLTFLHSCLEVNNACYLLKEARFYGYLTEEKTIFAFIKENATAILQSEGICVLTRDLLNEVLTLPGAEMKAVVKKQAANRWARNQCEENKDFHEETMTVLHDCFYVHKDDQNSHRFILDSLTSRNFSEDNEDPNVLSVNNSDISETDGVSSTIKMRPRSADHSPARLPCRNMWPSVQKVTRFRELLSSGASETSEVDAISFTVSHNLYLYGLSIYGPRDEQEGKYQVDTILYQRKKTVNMETIHITGAGVILPLMFERPVRIDKNCPYTVEIYIQGPETHVGVGGDAKVEVGSVQFTFSNASQVKKNQTNVSRGQIPRLFFLPQ